MANLNPQKDLWAIIFLVLEIHDCRTILGYLMIDGEMEGEEWSIRRLIGSMSVASSPEERLFARDRLTAIAYVRIFGMSHQDLVESHNYQFKMHV